MFTIAASDYLDPLFLPELVARIQPAGAAQCAHRAASRCRRTTTTASSLARGELDLVIGNWLEPPGELHLGRLFTDDIVCLVGEDHPATRNPRAWNEARYLAAEHVAPTLRLRPACAASSTSTWPATRACATHVAVRSPHFGLIPLMLAQHAPRADDRPAVLQRAMSMRCR